MRAFQVKLDLFATDLSTGRMLHFPTLPTTYYATFEQKMYWLYEFSNDTIEVGRLSLIEGEYDPELDKQYLVWWPQNGKKMAWTAKVLSTGGKLAYLNRSYSLSLLLLTVVKPMFIC